MNNKIERLENYLIEIHKAKEKIIEAEKAKCTCSGFVLQYEGSCQCSARFALGNAKSDFWSLIEDIRTVVNIKNPLS